MSKLLKTKILLGVLALVAVVTFAVSASAATYTMTLKYGMRNAEVLALQNQLGVTPATGYFGNLTKAAVMAFQTAHGLTADGIVGAKTIAALEGATTTTGSLCPNGMTLASNCTTAPTTTTTETLCPNGMTLASNCTTAPGTTTTTSTGLTGTYGTIATVTQISQYNNEEVGAGQNDVKIAGFEVKASNDGDIQLQSIKLTFDASGNGAGDSDRLVDYVDGVSLWMGSTEIGSGDAADFTRDASGIYSKTISLNNAIVRADDTEKFYIAIDAVSNLDSGDINSDSWKVGVNNVRYVDGSGVVTTDADVMVDALEYNSSNSNDGVSFDFVTFSSAADTELKVSLSSSTPVSGVSTVSTTANTDGVELLKGKLKLEGTSDVWLDELAVLFTTDATNVDDVTATVYLTLDGEEYSESMTATAGTTEAITFDDLDTTITAGDTVDFTISADINDIEAGTFDEGKYLKAELDSTRRALMVTENEEGDALTDATELTGTAMGNSLYFYSIAPSVSVVSASITPNDNGSNPPVSATANMKLKITANGGTIYLNGDDETTQAKEFFGIAVDGGDASSSVSSYTFTPSGSYTVTNSGSDNEYYTLYEDDTMYVTIEAVVTEAAGSSAILVGMKGDEILFGTDNSSDTTRSANTMNWTTLTDLLKTGKTTLDS